LESPEPELESDFFSEEEPEPESVEAFDSEPFSAAAPLYFLP
jgi:hypothetical protein